MNTVFDDFHLRIPLRSVGHEHERLKGIPNMVIHEVDQVQVLVNTPQSLAFIRMKDRAGNQSSQQIVGYSERSLKATENGQLIYGDQES